MKTIDNIPFVELSKAYSRLLESSWNFYRDREAFSRTKAERIFLERWNQTHEDSFEGDFEEESGYQKEDFNGLGSDEQKELKLFLEEFSTKYKIQTHAEWIFSQMLARFAELPLKKNDAGFYSAKALLTEIRKSPFLSGMWVMCKYPSRGCWIKGQTDPKFRDFCALVPLIMSAFKKYRNIPYSMWERSEIAVITESSLAEVMLLSKDNECFSLGLEALIAARNEGLLIKSGLKEGQFRSATSSFVLYIPKHMGLGDINSLGKLILTQCWCAHPTNRTQYMILDPLNWDDIPDALVSTKVLDTSNYGLDSLGSDCNISNSLGSDRKAEILDIPWM